MAIDLHAHLYHPSWYPAKFNDCLVRDFARRTSARKGGAGVGASGDSVIRFMTDRTGEATLRIMDSTGIEKKVILIVDWGLELGEPVVSIGDVHREVLEICRKSAGRLIGFAGLDPRRAGAVETLRHAIDDLGARGLKLHPTGAWSLEEERTFELVSLAGSRGLPVLVHVGRTMDILRDEHSQPGTFMRLARRFPGTKFIAGHSGFELFRVFVETADVPENIYFDISGWQDLVQGRPELLQEYLGSLLQAFPNRVCFGTDSPFFSYNLIGQERRWVQMVENFAGTCADALRESARVMLQCSNIFPAPPASHNPAPSSTNHEST